MRKTWVGYILMAASLPFYGCLESTEAPKDAVKGKSGSHVNSSDPYKAGYQGPSVRLTDPYLQGKDPYPALSQRVDTAGSRAGTALGKASITGSYVGIIPWDITQCPSEDRVNIYMDDEDNENQSSLTSLAPIPAGLDDGNPSNTRMILCKVPGGNFRRLQTVNYVVFNFGDGTQSCANGGINYEQTIDNENYRNYNSWSGCCGSNNPDWWSTGGAYSGYVRLRLCYYPKDPTAPSNLYLPSWLSRNYGVFTEAGQNNPYMTSWGTVRQDDEDDSDPITGNNANYQIKVGSSSGKTETGDFQGILDFSASNGGGNYTIWRFGKMKNSG